MAQRFGEFFLEPEWPRQNDENNPRFANLDIYQDQALCLCKVQQSHPPNVAKEQEPPSGMEQEVSDEVQVKQEEISEYSDDEGSEYQESSFGKSVYTNKKSTFIKFEESERSQEKQYIPKPIGKQRRRIKQISINPPKQKKSMKKKKVTEYERGKYKILSQDLKKQIVEQSKITTMVEVSRKYHVSVNNICRWRKRCDRRSGAGRKVTDMEMEKKLLEWLLQQHSPIARRQVQSRARKMSRQQGFKASKGWFQRFYKRNRLDCNENIQILTHNDLQLRRKSKISDMSNQLGTELVKKEEEQMSVFMENEE